jgi:RNA polymerase sigma-70 factor (ECF subfamily)
LPEPGVVQHRQKDAPFAHFFTHRSMLRAYLHALLRDRDLVEDTLSDVAVQVARSWDNYDQRLPFGPWVRGVARRVALKRMYKRDRAEIALPDEVLESLGQALDEISDNHQAESQKQQLRRCMESLSARNRELLQQRYFENQPLPTIAERSKRSLGALYTAFSRIHAALLRCMERAEERER